MDSFLVPFVCALVGAVFQEILKIYTLYSSGTPDDLTRVKRPGYIILSAIVILCSAAGSVVWNLGNTIGPRDYLVMGAAFPLMFKAAVNAVASSTGRTTLGPASLGDLIRLYAK